ncbi:ABC transporter substrate-binding protein [Halosimplex aquaticum]|uniref:ABC transporter substrate-binding protein n=1 Tax=Halosimplex aquaticum TaxID=3026162 RepID=A0ABD5Y0D3_9EURY|nr:ABC transporter substrate-binding protein [Halosimplex aquaticum]
MGEKDTETTDGPSRRDYLQYGAALGAGLVAGCTGGGSTPTDGTGEGADDPETASPSPTPTATPTPTTGDAETAATDSPTPTDGTPYTVEMAPMGEVTFEEVPQTIFTRLTHLAGMAFAVGRGNDVNAMHAPDYYHALWNQFTPRLPGVELDWSGLYSSWEPTKERLYELDSDVHLADPASVLSLGSWNAADVEEVRENIGPWFGNHYSNRHLSPPDEYADRYRYYGLWEMFEKVAQVFRAGDRYEALAEVHATVRETIEANLPPKRERPTALMAGLTDVESPWVYKTDAPGFLAAHVRPLGARGALGEDVSSGSQIDMEGLLEADPDVIFALGGMHPDTDMARIRQDLEDHSVGSQISAVENGRVYAQGARYQGPILNLFQLEMTAKQLYPETFGEWPTYVDGPYPEIPAEEQLFDRQRVADVINGDI